MMVGRSQAIEPSGPRFYDLADGQLKALHHWGDEWWIFRRHVDGQWVSDRELTIDDAVKILIAAEKKHRPVRVHQLEQASQQFVGELVCTFAGDSISYLQGGEPVFAEQLMQYAKFVRDRAIELGLSELGQLKAPDSKSGEMKGA